MSGPQTWSAGGDEKKISNNWQDGVPVVKPVAIYFQTKGK
jgi:hypothetical protein